MAGMWAKMTVALLVDWKVECLVAHLVVLLVVLKVDTLDDWMVDLTAGRLAVWMVDPKDDVKAVQ